MSREVVHEGTRSLWSASPTVLLVLLGLAVLGGLLLLGSIRRAAASTSRAISLHGRVLATAAVLVGLQWLVITRSHNTAVTLITLALPALLAATLLTRALTVVPTMRRGGGRR